MDIIKPVKETPMSPALAMIADVIREYEPNRLDENTIASLKFMIDCEEFASIRDVVESKIIEIGEFFKEQAEKEYQDALAPKNPKTRPSDTRKKKKKETASQGPTFSVDFVQTPDGIFIPKK